MLEQPGAQTTAWRVPNSEKLIPCPYLPDRDARLPTFVPLGGIDAASLDGCLAAAFRRSGSCLYHTDCPTCSSCESIRVDVDKFVPSRTQRRAWRRGCNRIAVEIGEPLVDEERVAIFNMHRTARGLSTQDLDQAEYATFLVQTCCESVELRYRTEGRLIAVAIADVGAQSLSAVYCYFDPAFSHLSPGTFSILKQIEVCRQQRLQYLYLGYYIAESPHMSYKARYLPHERFVDGAWRQFERD